MIGWQKSRSAAARNVALLMGRRARLRIWRPTLLTGYRFWRKDNFSGYKAWLEREKNRIGGLRSSPAGNAKRAITQLRHVPPEWWCRQVDGSGRCFGPRLQHETELPGTTRVRIVNRQEEDLHSQLSRMMKRAHKAAMKD